MKRQRHNPTPAKTWRKVQRATRVAQAFADDDREPFAVVQQNGLIFARPLRRALAMRDGQRLIVTTVYPRS